MARTTAAPRAATPEELAEAAAAAAAPGAEERIREAVRSESPEEPPPVPSVIHDRFEVGKKIGSGSYSDVYVGFDLLLRIKIAIKFEWQFAEKGRRLLMEADLYQTMKDESNENIPQVIWSGTHDVWNVMVLQLLGPSLEDLFKGRGRRLALKTVVMLGVQMIDRLEFVHKQGIIHRDIKPHNFLMGIGDNSGRVYIMDFGLARTYMDPDTGEHIPCKKRKGLTGTVRYTSMNVHKGLEPSRRDDLIAVGYVLMHFNLGKLPWQGVDAKSKRTKQRRIGRCKEQISHEELCRGYPREFEEYLHVCENTAYDEEPNYSHLRNLLVNVATRYKMELDWQFEWMLPTPKAIDTPAASTDAVGANGHANGDRRSPSRKKRRILLSAAADRLTPPKSPALSPKMPPKSNPDYVSYDYYDDESEEEESEESEESEEEEPEESEWVPSTKKKQPYIRKVACRKMVPAARGPEKGLESRGVDPASLVSPNGRKKRIVLVQNPISPAAEKTC